MARKCSVWNASEGCYTPERDEPEVKVKKKKTEFSFISKPFTPDELFEEIRRLRRELSRLLKTKKQLTS